MTDSDNTVTIDITSPKNNAQFQSYWVRFAGVLSKRDGFSETNLKNIEILCDLYVRYDELNKIITDEGSSFKSAGRYGTQIKSRPEATMLKDVLAEIRQYTRLLGIVMDKVKGGDTPTDPEGNDWNE